MDCAATRVWTMPYLITTLQRTATPLSSSRIAGFDDALWGSEVADVITVERLSFSSGV